MKIAIIQIEPVFLNLKETWNKLKSKILDAVKDGAELVTWGETLLPGYPQWVSITNGAQFNSPLQKKLYAKYWQEALPLNEHSILLEMQKLAKESKVMFMGGIAERSRGSIYCTLLTIGKNGVILGRHRKVKPTYEERLVWADGDGLGLKTYPISNLGSVGGLNCWENWLPLARASLHMQNELVHVSVWPGSIKLTKNITKFTALEGRSFIIASSGLLRADTVHKFLEKEYNYTDSTFYSNEEFYQNGGSWICGPNGKVITEPLINEEGILFGDVNLEQAIQERQNLDISGHYSRFDIFNYPLRGFDKSFLE